MTEITHRFVEANGLRMHIAEAGQGPLVVLLHGFPECWYSWRRQIVALAEAGYHVVAPDQRGYGQTDSAGEDAEKYTRLHLAGDIVGLIDTLGEQQMVVVGHDWGALVAWDLAMMRPDRVRGVVALNFPYWPRMEGDLFKVSPPDGTFYIEYFLQPGQAEAEMEQDVSLFLRKMYYTVSGEAPERVSAAFSVFPSGMRFVDALSNPDKLPDWLTERDLAYSAQQFERTGFRGGLNWYRAAPLNWELMGAWNNAPLLTPALYIMGERDVVTGFPGYQEVVANMVAAAPQLKEPLLFPGCGHWTQAERPEELKNALITFLKDLAYVPTAS
ncbi:alpha/beta hydrolase [Ktedonosporobacter rubrisoli]|uniref:Alpha/beta hydrolase n=1 Tax=Ktedonosporobacter rubrisoli TaxID=2509675 RepID=A0A4P6JJ01_KTERU|nr:alpha/beta hydrolase [Ktedonosporobacter rubrisoli]QBD75074.1 alpha/beta hydrolase [Ktedonosporobacter rubrisoli]